MLSRRRAARLALLTERDRGSPHPRWRVRRAWRALERAGDRGERPAIEVVWQSWLRVPDDARWELLSRWRDPADLAAAVLAAAVDPDLAAARRAAIGGFCAARRLVPDDGIERALFYVLTGQLAQHQAADPDGSLLAAGYRAAADPARAALRAAMTGAGELDLVRVLAAGRGAREAGRDPGGPMTGGEREYLAAELARRRDWPALWRAALGFPLPDAVAAVRLLDPAWRPAEERDRALLARFAGAGPVTDWAERLTVTACVEVPGDGGPKVIDASFAPDGRRLALLVHHQRGYLRDSLYELTWPDGALTARHTYEAGDLTRCVLHLGDAIAVSRRYVLPAYDGRSNYLDVFPDGRDREVIDGFPAGTHALAPHGEGFVALVQDELHSWEDRRNSCRLLFYDRDRRVQRSVGLRTFARRWVALAGDPASGRIAVHDARGVAVYDPSRAEPIARWRSGIEVRAMCFAGEDRLAVTGSRDGWEGHLALWGLDGQPLARRSLSPTGGEPSGLLAHTASGEIAVVHSRGPDKQSLRFFGARTLADADDQRGAVAAPRIRVWGSPAGGVTVVARSSQDDDRCLINVKTPLAGRPVSELAPADLARVTAALSRPASSPAQRPALELLRACLEYRFGQDVALGDARPAPAGPDDIAIRPMAG